MNAEGRVGVHPQTRVLAFTFVLGRLVGENVDSHAISIRLVELFSYNFHLKGEIDV